MTDQDLAGELLRELAELPELKPRANQLRELARAIATPGQAEQWCEVDLFAAFPPRESVRPSPEGSRWHGTLKIFDLLQTVLVFLPIAVTWFGLKSATSAYGEALATGGVETARRPFLEMWQQGFDGHLSGWLRFDNVAMATLVTIGLLIGVTLGERLLRRAVEQRADEQAERLRARLLAALTRAATVLAQVRLSSPARFQAELTKSAAEMHRVGETIGKVHTQVMEALEDVIDANCQAAAALKSGVADVRDAITTLDKHLTAVTASAQDLLQAVDRAGHAIDTVGGKTDEAVDRVGDRLEDVILDATRGVRLTLDEMTAITGQAVRDMATSTGQAVRDTAQGLDARIGDLVSATAGISSAATRVETATTGNGDRISRVLADSTDAFTAALGSAGAEVKEALDDWAGSASAHASRIEMVSDTAGRTVRLLEETRDALIGLRELDRLQELPAGLTKALQEVPSAVQGVTGPELAALESAITRLDDAVRQAGAAISTGLAAVATDDIHRASGRTANDAVYGPGNDVTSGAPDDLEGSRGGRA